LRTVRDVFILLQDGCVATQAIKGAIPDALPTKNLAYLRKQIIKALG